MSLYQKLKNLFQTEVIIKESERKSLKDRFNRIRMPSGHCHYNRILEPFNFTP